MVRRTEKRPRVVLQVELMGNSFFFSCFLYTFSSAILPFWWKNCLIASSSELKKTVAMSLKWSGGQKNVRVLFFRSKSWSWAWWRPKEEKAWWTFLCIKPCKFIAFRNLSDVLLSEKMQQREHFWIENSFQPCQFWSIALAIGSR